jgi:hypothetical protein
MVCPSVNYCYCNESKLILSFLALGVTTITPSTYLGAVIPGLFCSNYAYHFQVDGQWTTPRQQPRDSSTSLNTLHWSCGMHSSMHEFFSISISLRHLLCSHYRHKSRLHPRITSPRLLTALPFQIMGDTSLMIPRQNE